MRTRNTWLLEDVRSFDEPSDWAVVPELGLSTAQDRNAETEGFRALIVDDDGLEPAPPTVAPRRVRARTLRTPARTV